MRTTRRIITTLVTIALLSQAAIASPVARPDKALSKTDWSKAMVESTIKRFPTADSLKGWGYAKSLYLYGQYLVYLRTHDPRYLDHVKAWIDLHVDDQGTINRPIDALDYMLQATCC
jgi:unsaturated rhamnogalacturonyl hydrolase